MNIDTSRLAETEAGSTIPPWPVDFGPKEPEPELDDMPEGFAISVLAVVCGIVGVVGLAHIVSRLL